jgi:hypothetical protein
LSHVAETLVGDSRSREQLPGSAIDGRLQTSLEKPPLKSKLYRREVLS